MDYNYNSDPQRPRKRVSRETLRKRQLGGLAAIAFIVLLIVVIFANACTKKSDKKDSGSGSQTTTQASTEDVGATDDLPTLSTTTAPPTEATTGSDSGFKLSRTTAYFAVGESGYAAIISEYPAGSTEADEVWTSSDPSIASVNNLGYVSAVAPGECYITVSTAKDSTKTAMIKVVVTKSGN